MSQAQQNGCCGPVVPENPPCYVPDRPAGPTKPLCCAPVVPENPRQVCPPKRTRVCPPDTCCEFDPCCPCPQFIHPSRCFVPPPKCVRLPRECPIPCERPQQCCPPRAKCIPCHPVANTCEGEELVNSENEVVDEQAELRELLKQLREDVEDGEKTDAQE
jgi:hypothetical protein